MFPEKEAEEEPISSWNVQCGPEAGTGPRPLPRASLGGAPLRLGNAKQEESVSAGCSMRLQTLEGSGLWKTPEGCGIRSEPRRAG